MHKIFSGAGVICAFSTRSDGNMSYAYGDTKDSLKHRKAFLSAIGIDYRDLTCAKQAHGDQIACVRLIDKGKGALLNATSLVDIDALVTNQPQLPLAIFTADCLSIFLYEPKVKAIGIVHAGWRGTQREITLKTAQVMKKKFGAAYENIRAAFGPAIRGCCYEVGEDFKHYFDHGLSQKDSRYYFDLAAVNGEQLLDAGVREENITDTKICTSCRNKEFFSFRKEGKSCGRLMSVMMLGRA